MPTRVGIPLDRLANDGCGLAVSRLSFLDAIRMRLEEHALEPVDAVDRYAGKSGTN